MSSTAEAPQVAAFAICHSPTTKSFHRSGSGEREVVGRAEEAVRFDEHRERSRAAVRERGGEVGGTKVGADEPFRRRRLLQLRDDARERAVLTAQRGSEAGARCSRLRTRKQYVDRFAERAFRSVVRSQRA